jgi:hypothetical protein
LPLDVTSVIINKAVLIRGLLCVYNNTQNLKKERVR